MKIAKIYSGYRTKPLPGPKTLVLTHLREERSYNTRLCRKMWQMSDPVFNGSPFGRRLYLQENGADFLPGVDFRPGADDKVYSSTGALYDATPMNVHLTSMQIFTPASERGFTAKGNQVFFLGGGNLSFCLRKTFESLVKIKMAQGESMQAVIPTPLLYDSRVMDKQNYPLYPNEYLTVLEENARHAGYRVSVDGMLVDGEAAGNAAVELHWYSNFISMFASPFFPELTDTAAFSRAISYFKHV